MTIDKEGDLKRSTAGYEDVKQTETIGRNNTGKESFGPGMVQVNELMLRKNLTRYQAAADGLTEAGLGTYNYTIAEEQIHPDTGLPLPKDSRIIVVTYTGLENRDKLLEVVEEAGSIQWRLEMKGKPQEEIDRLVKSAVADIITLIPEREERERKFNHANTLAVLANHQRVIAAAYFVPGEEWRTKNLLVSASKLEAYAGSLHEEVGDSKRRENLGEFRDGPQLPSPAPHYGRIPQPMRKVEQGDFIASRDMVDSIRLDISTVHPRLQETLGRLVREFSDTLVEKYGVFMPKSRAKVSARIEHRLLLLEKDSFRTFYDAWVPREEKSGYPVAGVFRKGRIIVFLNPYEAWTDISEVERRRFIDFFGSEEDAREEVMLGNLISNIAHETVHHYQDWSLPELFLELGTRYYQREIMQEMGYDYGTDDFNSRRIEFYRTLLEKPWGDDVHRLYFGALKSPYPKDVVLGLVGADFFPQSPLLFPTGYPSGKR